MDVSKLKYAKTHEWVRVDGNEATIGISDFAVKQLTDLVYIGLPNVGKKLKSGETFGEVESVKAVSDLYAPFAGEVVAVNQPVVDDLGILSEDPYEKGWLIRVRMDDPTAANALLDRAAYEAHIASEEH